MIPTPNYTVAPLPPMNRLELNPDYVGVAHFSVFYLFENRRRRLKIFGILNSELGALSALNFGFIAPDLRSQFRILL